ncbi:MAG TPA: competence protein ComEA, partial [Anaerolineae bacterium]
RQAHGPFKRIEDIDAVQGIGDAIFAAIKDSITVGQ